MKKLFWEDAYLTECKAYVISVAGKKVKLDQTVFFAFSGGQESDTGTIDWINVVSAVKQGDKENIIDIEYELAEEPLFKVGDEVVVKIDGEKRAKLRRMHSAAHVVYYFMIEKLGRMKIIGSNVTSEKARLDFEYEKPITEVLGEIEGKVNNFISFGHEVKTVADEAKQDLRWWTCGEWKMPCGGTHVRNTNEIGKVILKRKNLGAGKERVEIVVGT